MNVLFVCKHNMFRSKVAQAHFKKINKNSQIKVDSAGPIKGYFPLEKEDVASAKELGVKIHGRPKGTSIDLLKKQDIIVIVADDVPEELVSDKRYVKDSLKVIKWNIRDDLNRSKDDRASIIKQIKDKVEELEKELNDNI